jgi:hypothetical protein
MSRFFVCKFCYKKVAKTYLAGHILGEHFERCYSEVIIGEQTTLTDNAKLENVNIQEVTHSKDIPELVHAKERFENK